MSLYFITGVTGAGKSTIRDTLRAKGYEAHDVDEDDLAAFYNKQTGQQEDRPQAHEERTAEWYAQHGWNMSRPAIEKLATQARGKPVFLCGVASNNMAVWDLFARVFCLRIDQQTLTQRLATRTNNDFGKAPDELRNILSWHQWFEQQNAQKGATMLDATQPLETIVAEILAAV